MSDIVEVIRDGEVVPTIYGTREGLQIVSQRIEGNMPFRFETQGIDSLVVPLLAEGEMCPWCSGTRESLGRACPVCARKQ